MPPPRPPLGPALLAALGLLACDDGGEGKADACLSIIDTDTDIGPCLDSPPFPPHSGDTDTDTDTDVGPCLDIDTDTDTDTIGPCLDFPPHTGDTDTDTDTIGPCLDFPPHSGDTDTDTDVGPCLDTDLPDPTGHTGGDTDTATGPCLDIAPTAHTGAPDTDVGPCLSPPLETAIGPCLDLPHSSPAVATPDTAGGHQGAATTRDDALRRVLARGVLPDDVARALADRLPKGRG